MKSAQWAAIVLIGGGVAILAVYWVVAVVGALFGADDVPVPIKIAVTAVVAGAAVLLAIVIVQRMRERKEENLKEIEY